MTKRATEAITAEDKAALADHLSNSRKYRNLILPDETLLDLIEKAALSNRSIKEVEDVVRRKLHNLVAPYLGDPQYADLIDQIPFLPGRLETPEVQQFCLDVLNSHASTRERVPINEQFYQRIFAYTGLPSVVLDLACGLNPFALPWMHLPTTTHYMAFDLHLPRVNLINAFFQHIGGSGVAFQQDILLEPPRGTADVAFFFKEAHRFEQRESGSVRTFLENLQAKFILLSLPTETLTGRRSMLEQDCSLVSTACASQPWRVEELVFSSEIVFCIQKAV